MLRRTLRWTLQDFEVFLPYQFYGQYWKTGWWFGTFFVFPYIGNVIIPTDQYLSEGLTPPTRQYWKNLKHRGLVGRLFPRISPQITQTERFSWYQSFPELGRNSWTITIFCFAQNPLRRNRLFEVGMRCPVLSLLFEVLNMAMLPWRNCWVKQKWTSTFSSISIHFPQGRSLWTSLKMDTQLGSPRHPGYGGGSTARHQDGLGTWQKGWDRPSLSQGPRSPFLTDFQICVKVSLTKPY